MTIIPRSDEDEDFWGPGGKQAYLVRLKAWANMRGKQLEAMGLFEWDEVSMSPVNPTRTFSRSELLAQNKNTMAHIMFELGMFPSVNQARKNGWDKPIELGEHVVTKRKIKFIVVE